MVVKIFERRALRRLYIASLIIILVLSCLGLNFKPSLKVANVSASNKTWYVPLDFPNITSAIQSPSVLDGDTIIVLRNPNGAYKEGQIDVIKSLNITADKRWGEVIIEGNGKGDVIKVTADNVTIKGFTITGSGLGTGVIAERHIYLYPYAGINIFGVRNCRIEGNLIYNNSVGVLISTDHIFVNGKSLKYAENVLIFNNTISNNKFCGIGSILPVTLQGTFPPPFFRNIEIINNNVVENNWYIIFPIKPPYYLRGGISVKGINITLVENTVADNNEQGLIVGGENLVVERNILQNNTLGGILATFWYYSLIFVPPYYFYYTYPIPSNASSIKGNVIKNNKGIGFSVEYWYNTTILDNVILYNDVDFSLYIDEPKYASTISIETNNFVTNGKIYYIVGGNGLNLSLKTIPDAGYLAVANSMYITIEGLNFSRNGQGIYLCNVTKSKLENVTIRECLKGLSLQNVTYTTIINSQLLNNTEVDLDLTCSDENVITSNILKSGGLFNVRVYSSNRNKIYANVILNYFNQTYPPCPAALFIINSHGNQIFGNRILTSTADGMIIRDESVENKIFDNKIISGGHGVHLLRSINNDVLYNQISASKIAALLEETDNNIIYGNIFYESFVGINLTYSNNNIIYHNDFIRNIQQAFTINSTGNIWDAGPVFGGNYWSDYNGTDANGDGIGETPYIIDGDNVDHYPLIHPCSPHDITISKIMVKSAMLNQTSTITVAVKNSGVWTETFTLYLNYTRISDPPIGSQTVSLAPGELLLINFTWTPTATGLYKIEARINPVPFEFNLEDNDYMIYIYVTRDKQRGRGGELRWQNSTNLSIHLNLIG
ncbi:MAG: NosD domain-containing protein [Candidatus Bathyarchaeia archaeon]